MPNSPSLGDLGDIAKSDISKVGPFSSFARANNAAWGMDAAGEPLKRAAKASSEALPGQMGTYQPGPFSRAAREAIKVRRAKRAAKAAGRANRG